MKRWRGIAALFAAPMALYWPEGPRAYADTRAPMVVLLRPEAQDEVTTEATARVMGELKAAGFDVVAIPSLTNDARRDLEMAGRDLKPIAAFAIFVRPSNGGTSVAEIWVSDRVKQQTVVENAILHETDRGRGAEILAVRAVEFLKANLASFWAPAVASTPAASATPSPSARPPTGDIEFQQRPAFASGLGMGLGVGILETFGAMSTSWNPDAMVSYGWPHGLSVRVCFVGLGSRPTLFAADGSAATALVEEHLGMLEAVKTWWPRSALVPFVFAGSGTQHIHVTGAGPSPHRGHITDDWSLLATIGLGAAIPLVSRISLVLEGRLVNAWPSSVVRIDSADVGRLGMPSLLLDGGFLGLLP